MNSKAALGLTAGALAVGLLAGLAIGGDSGAPKQTGPGPTMTVDGVPAGFKQSREGAVAAANAYSRILSSLALRDEEGRRRALDRLSSAAGSGRVAKQGR